MTQCAGGDAGSRVPGTLLLAPWIVNSVLFLLMFKSIGSRPRLAVLVVLYVLLNVCVPAVVLRNAGEPPLAILFFLLVFRVMDLEVLGMRGLFVAVWQIDPADLRRGPAPA